jgi:REP element-mobilizing transposase RayT
LHHVIVRGIEKGLVVRDDKDREAFVTRLGHAAMLTQTNVYAWALLPNHVHVLVRSSAIGLPAFMRRFLTGYAVTFNRRHERRGHLFENRYKSIVCDEDSYFQELVRYIHLNPLRAGLCADLIELGQYPWCGHSVILGKFQYPWCDREHVLSWFGTRGNDALAAYRRFVRDGIAQGRRPELVGGGLVRTLGGWAAVQAARSRGDRVLADPRILGTGSFVEALLSRDEGRLRRTYSITERAEQMEELIRRACVSAGIDLGELQLGGRRRSVAKIRAQLARQLVGEYGVTLAEAARRLGVSTSGIAKIFERARKK